MIKRLSKFQKHLIVSILILVLAVTVCALAVNGYVILSQRNNIISEQEVTMLDKVDYVIVLGCGVREDGSPSTMLTWRLDKGSNVTKSLNSVPLLLTGDNSGEEYNELAAMKSVSLLNGVEEEKIVIDDFGFSTYESMYNAKNVFGANRVIIITQKYHMYRALYIARSLGMEAYGVDAGLPFFPRQIIWSLREVLARNKDFLLCEFN